MHEILVARVQLLPAQYLVCFSSELIVIKFLLEDKRPTQQDGRLLPHTHWIQTPHHNKINLQSHALLQTYSAILPTSLTYVLLRNQRFITLETCCGYWYGQSRTYNNEEQGKKGFNPSLPLPPTAELFTALIVPLVFMVESCTWGDKRIFFYIVKEFWSISNLISNWVNFKVIKGLKQTWAPPQEKTGKEKSA